MLDICTVSVLVVQARFSCWDSDNFLHRFQATEKKVFTEVFDILRPIFKILNFDSFLASTVVFEAKRHVKI